MRGSARLLVVLLTVALSGAAPLLAEALDHADCAAHVLPDGEGGDDGCSDCPTDCWQCVCCHHLVAVVPAGAGLPALAAGVLDGTTGGAGLALDGAPRGVFLPPRA